MEEQETTFAPEVFDKERQAIESELARGAATVALTGDMQGTTLERLQQLRRMLQHDASDQKAIRDAMLNDMALRAAGQMVGRLQQSVDYVESHNRKHGQGAYRVYTAGFERAAKAYSSFAGKEFDKGAVSALLKKGYTLDACAAYKAIDSTMDAPDKKQKALHQFLQAMQQGGVPLEALKGWSADFGQMEKEALQSAMKARITRLFPEPGAQQEMLNLLEAVSRIEPEKETTSLPRRAMEDSRGAMSASLGELDGSSAVALPVPGGGRSGGR